MSDFLNPEEKQERQKCDGIKASTAFSSAESAQQSVQKAAQSFAKPDTYTRKLFDSNTAKRAVKVEAFKGGAKVTDPQTGNTLLLTQQEAKEAFGEQWQKHIAESDHIVPLKHIFEKWGSNPWLKTNNIKERGNSSDNLQVIPGNINKAKGAQTNEEFVSNNGQQYLSLESQADYIARGIVAEKAVDKNLIKDIAKNITITGHEAGMYGAANSGGTALTMSGITNMIAVIKGEKSADEAVADTICDGGKAAVTGYVRSGGLTIVLHSLSGASSKFLQALSKSNVPGKVIAAVSMLGDTIKRYANGEITTQECIFALGDKGINCAATGYSMAVGQTLIPIPIVGAAIGALVGSVVTSGFYRELKNLLQQKELEHQYRLRIIAEYEQAERQIRAFREELESYLTNYFQDYRDCFDTALSIIHCALEDGDANGVIAGANQITKKLGGTVYYENMTEFIDFLADDSIDIL